VGTPHYMSPEQVQGQTVDGRSDQFSLAVIAFEMLTGEKPYTGEHLTTVVYKIVAEEPPAPHRINPSLGSAIEAVLRKGLAKKPDGRYDTCQQFVSDLETACAANAGWQSLPRGGSLNVPTMSDQVPTAAATALPPARRAQRADLSSTGTTERTPRQRSGFLPFLAAVLMAAGLLAVVAWEVKPSWLLSGSSSTEKQPEHADATPSPAPSTSPPPFFETPTVAKQPAASTAAPPVAAAPAGEPAEKAAAPVVVPGLPPATRTPSKSEPPAEKAPRRTTPPRVSPATQPVSVVSSPSGAIATLDGDADSACTTPCTLQALSGRNHTLVLNKDGFGLVRIEVPVSSSPVELPAVKMRALQGTLLLSSDPSGAAVLVDGKLYPKTTNTEIQLPPGKHSITVEWKNGKQTRTVEIKEGINHEKFVIEQ
jgi:Protein kinase domain/PEGA domain